MTIVLTSTNVPVVTKAFTPDLSPPHECSSQSDSVYSSAKSLLSVGDVDAVEPVSQVSQVAIQPVSSAINVHPMITRPKRGIYKPKVYNAQLVEPEPQTTEEVFASPQWRGV
ncbi:hypothetical protein GOBAR_DD18708 [Gossypium barbadense]|nr:hypothetical protein GOBAR_DD18708 [Gossypium barbadense]